MPRGHYDRSARKGMKYTRKNSEKPINSKEESEKRGVADNNSIPVEKKPKKSAVAKRVEIKKDKHEVINKFLNKDSMMPILLAIAKNVAKVKQYKLDVTVTRRKKIEIPAQLFTTKMDIEEMFNSGFMDMYVLEEDMSTKFVNVDTGVDADEHWQINIVLRHKTENDIYLTISN